jgi:hypothetical protein
VNEESHWRPSFAVLPSAVAPLTSERQYFCEATRRIAATDYVDALQLDVDCTWTCYGAHTDKTMVALRTPACRMADARMTSFDYLCATYHRLGLAGAMQEELSAFASLMDSRGANAQHETRPCVAKSSSSRARAALTPTAAGLERR